MNLTSQIFERLIGLVIIGAGIGVGLYDYQHSTNLLGFLATITVIAGVIQLFRSEIFDIISNS